MKLGLEVAGFLAGGGPGALDEGGLEPRRSFAHPGGTPLAGALVVLWAQAGPGDQVSGGREAAHVAADFGEDDASAQLVDAGNGSQELDRGSKGLDLSVDLLIDLSDGCVNRIDMLEEGAA
jgi:hypothetical protein